MVPAVVALWMAGSACGADLVVDGTTTSTFGLLVYDHVYVVNGGTLAVTPAGTGGSTGTLLITATSIFVDATSRIDGSGAGTQGIDGGTAVNGGGAGDAGGGASHGGLGSAGRDAACATTFGAAGPLSGTAPDLGTEIGSAGGGVTDGALLLGAGGAGGASIMLVADHLEIHGEVLADGGDGDPGAWGGAGGGAGGGILLKALDLVCDGVLSAEGGAGGSGFAVGGGGGGGIIEQWFDRSGRGCTTSVKGGLSDCADGANGIATLTGTLDWDADGTSTAAGDCDADDAAVHIGAAETCNAKDDDCDGLVDDSAGCLNGCTAFAANGETYLDCTTTRVWSNAVANCNAEAGNTDYHLWVVDDATEDAAVQSWLAANNNTAHWIAYNDQGTEGAWVWSAPVTSYFTNWNAGEPNNSGGNEDCAEYAVGGAVWNDLDCSNVLDFVCEACEHATYFLDSDGDGWGDPAETTSACYGPPGGYVAKTGDCDDTDSAVHPGAEEACDGIDNDCDGTLDPVTLTWFADLDHDGFGDGASVPVVLTCVDMQPADTAANTNDCDDGRSASNPDGVESCNGWDDDCDGQVDEGAVCNNCTAYVVGDSTYQVCTNDQAWDVSETTCLGIDATAGGPEYNLVTITDAAENALIDEIVDRSDPNQAFWIGLDDRAVENTFVWVDGTPFGFDDFDAGQPNNANGGQDCVETNNLGGIGDTNWNDQDCTLTQNRVCEIVCSKRTFYVDDDGDGWGDAAKPTFDACVQPEGYADNDADCDDADPTIHPNAGDPPADGIDGDCDGDDTCYVDKDQDGFGATDVTIDFNGNGCVDLGESDVDTDCADDDATQFPGATEVPGDPDLDCDGHVECYFDGDGDGHGVNPQVPSDDLDCSDVYESTVRDDCDDTDPSRAPGEVEIVGDGVDQDCDGKDSCWQDSDGDGFGSAVVVVDTDLDCDNGGARTSTPGDCNDAVAGINPLAVETPADGTDQDCDGTELCWGDGDGDAHAPIGAMAIPSPDLSCTDPGEAAVADDCNDADAAIYPGATEIVGDQVDQDCDLVDSCWRDGDLDGFGDGVTIVDDTDLDCDNGGTKSSVAGDCNDAVNAINPNAVEVAADGVDENCDALELCYFDADGDGSVGGGTIATTDLTCTAAGHATSPADCNDADPTVFPGAGEVVGDGLDQDCDGVDMCYSDADHDAYGVLNILVADTDLDCDDGGARASVAGDCNDANPAINPGAVEIVANGVDEDCNSGELCYADADADGSAGSATVASIDLDCLDPGEGSVSSDCNDADATIAPTAPEVVADGIDQDCDLVDSCFVDADLDTWGTTTIVDDTDLSCTNGGPRTDRSGDCDDGDAAVNPDAVELPVDGTDGDCDGSELCYADVDLDTYGDDTVLVESPGIGCSAAGVSFLGGDCDDADAGINPGAAEIPSDGIDQNCDGLDLCFTDADGDGYGDASAPIVCTDPLATVDPNDCDDTDAAISPAEAEIPGNAVDEDCSGAIACFVDADKDGYGDPGVADQEVPAAVTCDDPTAGWADDDLDCDDGDATISPSGTEIPADGIDQDCSGDDDCYADLDQDGAGDPANLLPCLGPDPTVLTPDDCDDADAAINPLAVEVVADDVDQDCDGLLTCIQDFDEDSFGTLLGTTATTSGPTCDDPASGVADDSLDCDDVDATVYPGAPTVPLDGIDQDCDGVDEADADTDTDTDSDTDADTDTDGDTGTKPGDTGTPPTGDLPSVDDRPLPGEPQGAPGVGCDCDESGGPPSPTGLLAAALLLVAVRRPVGVRRPAGGVG